MAWTSQFYILQGHFCEHVLTAYAEHILWKNMWWSTLTLREAWRVVINIRDHYGHCGGTGEAAHLACHICCLDNQLIAVLRLPIQIRHGRPDHSWRPKKKKREREVDWWVFKGLTSSFTCLKPLIHISMLIGLFIICNSKRHKTL